MRALVIFIAMSVIGCADSPSVMRAMDPSVLRSPQDWTQTYPAASGADVPVFSVTNTAEGGRIDVYAPLDGGNGPRAVLDEAVRRLTSLRPGFDALEVGEVNGIRRVFIDHALKVEGEMIAFVPYGESAWYVAVLTLPHGIGAASRQEWVRVLDILVSE